MIRGITEVEPRNETVRCHGTSRCCSFKRELDILQCCHENMWKIDENCGKWRENHGRSFCRHLCEGFFWGFLLLIDGLVPSLYEHVIENKSNFWACSIDTIWQFSGNPIVGPGVVTVGNFNKRKMASTSKKSKTNKMVSQPCCFRLWWWYYMIVIIKNIFDSNGSRRLASRHETY